MEKQGIITIWIIPIVGSDTKKCKNLLKRYSDIVRILLTKNRIKQFDKFNTHKIDEVIKINNNFFGRYENWYLTKNTILCVEESKLDRYNDPELKSKLKIGSLYWTIRYNWRSNLYGTFRQLLITWFFMLFIRRIGESSSFLKRKTDLLNCCTHCLVYTENMQRNDIS